MASLTVRLTSSAFRPSFKNVVITRHLSTSPRPAKLLASSFAPLVRSGLKSSFLVPKFSAGRGIVTEAPALTGPSQSERWKRYAITAVR
jgi:hypothetical protein